MDIQSEYEKLFPMTTWSDEEILAAIDKDAKVLNESQEDGVENIKENMSLEEYMKANKCVSIDDIINEISGKIK